MRRAAFTWLILAVCLLVALAVLGWLSATVLRLERAQTQARQQAALEENVRLALWRMDSALTPLIIREAGYPYFVYEPFIARGNGYDGSAESSAKGGPQPSPLLLNRSQYTLLHFQLSPTGELTSPQVPLAVRRAWAVQAGVPAERITEAEGQLARLRAVVERETLLAQLPEGERVVTQLAQGPEPVQTMEQGQQAENQPSLPSAQQQQQRSASEQQARARQMASNAFYPSESFSYNALPATADVSEGALTPVWAGDALLLARRVHGAGATYVQGCQLDWPGIQEWLAREVRDLLPAASLEPASGTPAPTDTRLLAALPACLVPGPLPSPLEPADSLMLMPLIVAWVCVLLAGGALAALLLGTLALSERRATFVSAVTHEMRTPLTTFRMYTEMLTKGMLPDEAKRQRYLTTLRTEANRLSHLVENVLAYARLERNRAADRVESLTVGDLIERGRERLAERARQAEMALDVQLEPEVAQRRLELDVAAFEQILMNLVDNACKYAATAAERTIHLTVVRTGSGLAFSVRDHGPGISEEGLRTLFRPFCKSAQAAASSAPGVGLGLALSRRLARGLGGDLKLDRGIQDGACFVLALPLR